MISNSQGRPPSRDAAQPMIDGDRSLITSRPGDRGPNLKELWRHRELLYFFVWRDLKVKYRQTLLGVAWAILVPVIQMVIFTVIFGLLVNAPTDRIPKPLFYFTALLPWTYFATSLTTASHSLVSNSHFLTKVYMPRLLIPLAPCIANLVDLLIAFVVLSVMLMAWGVTPPASSLFAPALMLIAGLTAYGVGLFLAALQVRYRDVRYVSPFLIQIWMYCTVIVPYSEIRSRFGDWAWLCGFNPMTAVVEGMRWCLLHGSVPEGEAALRMPWELVVMGAPVAVLAVIGGVIYFRCVEDQFADII